MSNILLLREPSPETSDRYETAFKEVGYHAKCVPVLETVHTNLDKLVDIIKSGSQFNGVIVTSKRACDSWKATLGTLLGPHSGHHASVAHWCTVPFYVVGQGTGSALREIQSSFQKSGFTSIDIRGESSGTGEQLAQFILNEDLRPGKLLYLTGDKNRDTVARILSEGRIEYQALQVYETRGRSDFGELLSTAIADFPVKAGSTDDAKKRTWWIVYFAPSTAAFVNPFLDQHFNLKSMNPTQTRSQCFDARIGSIGPTTTSFLKDELRYVVDVTASKPSPEELRSAILVHDGALVT